MLRPAPGPVLRSRWTPGPEHGTSPGAPLLVSVTDFRPHRAADLPGIHRAGRQLGSGWGELDGAYGMWLWLAPFARRCGAVAVWRDEEALRGFIGWPPHVRIMKEYVGRGELASVSWRIDSFDVPAIHRRARTSLRTELLD
ncbi:hypothetical protein ACFYVL_03385 [Streptomyces sp. NPDC004111]|uniref:hypothetical protein n=1 Tax=Streptomyces sp. NPDC004111 TaxID=3364690 RepID=UPI0036A24A79